LVTRLCPDVQGGRLSRVLDRYQTGAVASEDGRRISCLSSRHAVPGSRPALEPTRRFGRLRGGAKPVEPGRDPSQDAAHGEETQDPRSARPLRPGHAGGRDCPARHPQGGAHQPDARRRRPARHRHRGARERQGQRSRPGAVGRGHGGRAVAAGNPTAARLRATRFSCFWA